MRSQPASCGRDHKDAALICANFVQRARHALGARHSRGAHRMRSSTRRAPQPAEVTPPKVTRSQRMTAGHGLVLTKDSAYGRPAPASRQAESARTPTPAASVHQGALTSRTWHTRVGRRQRDVALHRCRQSRSCPSVGAQLRRECYHDAAQTGRRASRRGALLQPKACAIKCTPRSCNQLHSLRTGQRASLSAAASPRAVDPNT